MKNVIRKLVLWEYGRETSVYVIFCLLIVAFIFLTPKEWFVRADNTANRTTKIVVKASDIPGGRNNIQPFVAEISGRSDAEIIDIEERKDSFGNLIYDIEIR